MTLRYSTIRELPMLRSYAQALAHYNNVTPIKGDAHKTRPVGRRNQKWFNIVYDKHTQCVGIGYHVGQRAESDKPLIEYHADGRVSINVKIANGRLSSTCRERIQSITNIRIAGENNAYWVRAKTYVEGKLDGETMHLLIPDKLYGMNTQDVYTRPHSAEFILSPVVGDAPIFLNPVPAYKQILNRQAMREVVAEYAEFIAYAKGMGKLLGGTIPRRGAHTLTEEFGGDSKGFGQLMPMYVPHGRSASWGIDNRETLLAWAKGGEQEEMYKAVLWVAAYTQWYRNLCPIEVWVSTFRAILIRCHEERVILKKRMESGIIRNRYNAILSTI